MAGTKEIRRRIKSIKNTKKITKAMELVSAAKMRKAVSKTLSSRTYAQYAWLVLNSLTTQASKIKHPLLATREVKKMIALLVTSDRGLCGSYNTQVLKSVINELKNTNPDITWKFVVVGKKGISALQRLKQEMIGTFSDLPASLSLRQTMPISKLLIEEFKAKDADKIIVVYTDYVSALRQEALIRQLLPLNQESLKDLIDRLSVLRQKETAKPDTHEFLFEPNQKDLLPFIVEKLTHMQVYQMIMESNASEQSSRMAAMKNATDAAGEMIDSLSLVYNKARQSAITQEISEISAGSAAVE